MTTHTAEMSVDLPCHVCGYDVRAHPADGKCPECEASVAESRRLAAIPLRPAWRDSDPRWRRRILAGVWMLVLVPLMDVLLACGLASNMTVPTIFNYRGKITLAETLLSNLDVYQTLVFCIGVVLLFSREQGRRHARHDWTRRWGVLTSYVVLLLAAVQFLFISALVLAGIAALFLSMSKKYEPAVTQFFVYVSSTYLRYGAYPSGMSEIALTAFSSITVLLACFPLFDALRSSGSKRAAALLVAPLALFALFHLSQVARCALGFSGVTAREVSLFEIYFWPQLLVGYIGGNRGIVNLWGVSGLERNAFAMEAGKWCIMFAIAIWLTIAQVMAWFRRRESQNVPCFKDSDRA